MSATPEPDYEHMTEDELRQRYRDGDRAACTELDRRKLAKLNAERAAQTDGCVINPRTGEVIEVRETRARATPTATRPATRTATPQPSRARRWHDGRSAAAGRDD
jgi:hypothetical protein